MKGFLKAGIFFSLGLLTNAARAQDIQWRAGSAPPTSVAQSPTSQGVRLERPIPQDGGVPAFRPTLMRPSPVVRAQAPDDHGLPGGIQLTYPASVAQQKPNAPRPLVPPPEDLKPMPKAGEFVAPAPKPIEITPQAPTASPPPVHIDPHSQNRVWGTISNTPYLDSVAVGNDCATGSCPPANCVSGHCGSGLFGHRGLLGCGVFGHCGTDAGCNVCSGCANTRAWIGADYLMWWTRAQNLPPLLTTSTTAGTAGNNSAALTDPNVRVLIDSIDDTFRNGGRFYGGFYFPRHNDWGIDASYFFLGRESNTQAFTSADAAILARPIIVNGVETALYVNNPAQNLLNGRFVVDSYSEVHGFDINLRRKIWAGSSVCLDLLGGYRYFSLREGVDILDDETNPTVPTNSNIIAFDSFRTRNTFHGGQLGLAGHWQFATRWSLQGSVKVAFGTVNQVVDIQGNTQFVTLGATANGGGVLALASNIGRQERNSFAVLPEVGVKLGYDVSDHLRLHVGYDFLLISDVARAGEQIDRNYNPAMRPTPTNPNPLPTPPLVPAPIFQTTSFWATGINFGLTYHW